MPKTRVIHIITRMVLGGAQEDLMLSLLGLNATGRYEVGIVTGAETGVEGNLLRRAKNSGIPVFVLPELRREIAPLKDALAYIALRSLLRRYAPDIVQTHSSKAGILGRFAARAAGVPIVLHRIHGLAFHPTTGGVKNFIFKRLERAAAKCADKLITVADSLKTDCLNAGVGQSEQFIDIPTGIDTTMFEQNTDIRKKLGYKDDDFVIAYIARISPLKGHKYLPSLLKRLTPLLPNVKLLIVGDGKERVKIETTLNKQFPGVAQFTGAVKINEVPQLMMASDVLLHLSLREGLPRVFAESFLARIPVVAFDVDGARDIIRSDENGYIIKPRDINAAGEILLKLARDPSLRKQLANNGRELALRRFSASALVENTDLLYQELLSKKGIK